jgi:hypothetical protein
MVAIFMRRSTASLVERMKGHETMRTPLLIAAAVASLMPTPNAEACGGYGDFLPTPSVMVVSSHAARANPSAGFRQRSFVVFGQDAEAAQLSWRRLAVHSYDSTEIAAMKRLESPVELTIVGETGTRVVKTSRQVALRGSWQFEGAKLAVEIDGGVHDRQFAIVGAGESTSWIGLQTDDTGAKQRVPGTDATTRLVTAASGPATVISVGGFEKRRVPGYATGAIEWGGEKFVLIENRGTVTPVRI